MVVRFLLKKTILGLPGSPEQEFLNLNKTCLRQNCMMPISPSGNMVLTCSLKQAVTSFQAQANINEYVAICNDMYLP